MPPTRRKKVSPQTFIGEGGVSLIRDRVIEMRYLYHDRRVDHGIDGEIELVAPNGDALNRVIMVQSKASNLGFSYETEDSFQWTADPTDLDYWLGGNAPVIVVLSRPSERLAWWFDVRTEFGDPRRRAERTVTIDKRTQAFNETAASALMRLGVPRGSGLYLPPPPKTELLSTNLLPVEEWPDTLFVAPALVRDYGEAWERLKEEKGHRAGWILHDGMVISFGDLRSAPLRALCDGGVERHQTVDWADTNDEDRVHQFTELLRRTLIADRSRDLQWHTARHHMHFRATHDLKPRLVGREEGRRGRTVFGPHHAKADPQRVSYYHHAAVNPRFRRIDGRWFCQLDVGYCFTHDGKNESSFADDLMAGIKRMERHPAVSGWIRMWERYLQPDLFASRYKLGFGRLLTFEVSRGIDDRWWGPAPTAATEDDNFDESGSARDIDAALSLAGVEQTDLLSLLSEATEPETPPEQRRSKPRTSASRTRQQASQPSQRNSRNTRKGR